MAPRPYLLHRPSHRKPFLEASGQIRAALSPLKVQAMAFIAENDEHSSERCDKDLLIYVISSSQGSLQDIAVQTAIQIDFACCYSSVLQYNGVTCQSVKTSLLKTSWRHQLKHTHAGMAAYGHTSAYAD
jgi:hypothetical protein